jgi:hypothetical protein
VNLNEGRTVLLFYEEYERDSIFPKDRYLKRVVRPLYNRVRSGQSVSGFYMWYLNLQAALRQEGYRVETNNRRLARQNPAYPVGLVGYPGILDRWDLPNPVILGPGMYDHPRIRPDLINDERFQLYILTCEWMLNMFTPIYGSDCRLWHAGIDTDAWPDTRGHPKSIDILMYDKIRWDHDRYAASLLQPIITAIKARSLSYHVIRYGGHQQWAYRDLLRRSRAMIFLCEHETQGLAYQEALASNVPVLAWDNGYWLDPRRPLFEPKLVKASSVPYFSDECGDRFADSSEFELAFDRFLANLNEYEPRRFVQRDLSLEGSAMLYMQYYREIMGGAASSHRAGIRPPLVSAARPQ